MSDTPQHQERLAESALLYEDDRHQVVWFGWEEEEGSEAFVQTNQCLVINEGQGYFFDPGGTYVFHHVLENVLRYISERDIQYIIATHQDPDVSSSVPYWMRTTRAQLLISRLWLHFVSHFGLDDVERVVPVEDRGCRLTLASGDYLELIPSHFLHSPGNFSIYDSRSGMLFSGDIGASIFPSRERYLWVEDVAAHRAYMEGFHRRYMHSNRLCRLWVERIRRYDVSMIVPQHGALFPAAQVEPFLAWLEQLECGGDLADRFYN